MSRTTGAHAVFERSLVRRFAAPVVSSRALTPSTHAVEVGKPPSFSFRPTQFTFLQLRTEEGMGARPMSLATSPTRPNLEYAVRLSDSPYKRAFAALALGDDVLVFGPLGDFVLDDSRPAVLVAGGIGITPLKGMAEFAADRELPSPIRLVYSNRDEGEIPYRRELEELEKQNPNFRVFHTLTRTVGSRWAGRVGRIGPALLQEAARGVARPVYYVSGTATMVAAVARNLLELKVPEADIQIEVFRGY